MPKKNRRKPVSERITVEIDGVPRRLGWIAENKPEILAKAVLCISHEADQKGDVISQDVAWSVLYQHGWDRMTLLDKCRDWGLDAGILGHIHSSERE